MVAELKPILKPARAGIADPQKMATHTDAIFSVYVTVKVVAYVVISELREVGSTKQH